jgi:hypothetical protein
MPINGFLLEKQRMMTGTKKVTSELQAGTADHAPYFSLATSIFPHRFDSVLKVAHRFS